MTAKPGVNVRHDDDDAHGNYYLKRRGMEDMTIKTEDREVIKRKFAVIRKMENGGYHWRCDKCAFYRVWSTEGGAVNGVAEHLRTHGVRLTLPSAKDA